MHRLSLAQALDVWSELDDAYHGRGQHDTNTAEIYLYRLTSRSTENGAEEAQIEARKALANLLGHFEKTRDVTVLANGRMPALLPEDTSHRVVVTVRPWRHDGS